ncbi:MAG: response regulator [Syntrophobacteraceae bacterium]|jgi:heterodisulfide reductase subunit A|nr:response regulator [Syntrophobacteraceae bacterium]
MKKIGSALVVGAGISGIRSALDLAETGYRVTLIDRAPHIGGTLRQLDYQFPTDHCGMCKMLPLTERDQASQFCLRKGLFHDNIDVLLSTELVGMEGDPGRYKVRLRRKPTLVSPDRCVGCGECSRVCPVEAPDEFNAGLTVRKAAYLPVPHNIPNHYIIDTASCTRCGECEKICPTQAIDLGTRARSAFRILVVDDEFVVRDSIKEWLTVEGYHVDMAESGFEAVDRLAAQAYGLMLVDIKMPGMDGVEVLKRAKELNPDMPVVMMTAYATVETAVEAMKVGARDYLMKPFDPEAMAEQVARIYEESRPSPEEDLEVGAVILAAGFAAFDPRSGLNTHEYGVLPGVMTSIEFERLISGTGPNGGRLLHPADGREVRRVAWLQCVGSRSLGDDADFCSSACCMYSIKEAVLTRERSGGAVDAAIFYMDLRTFGKDFQRYRDDAEDVHGVRFVRSRVHTVAPSGSDGMLLLDYSTPGGESRQELFDLVVLAVGQRPPEGTRAMAELTGIELSPWGFCKTQEFSLSRTSQEGVLVAGSFTGLRDISESVIQAGSASLAASALIHAKGGGLAQVPEEPETTRNVLRELPRAMVVLCSCGGLMAESLDHAALARDLSRIGMPVEVLGLEAICTRDGWTQLEDRLRSSRANRVLIGACMPHVYSRKLKELGRAVGLQPSLLDVVDLRTSLFPGGEADPDQLRRDASALLRMKLARLQEADPAPPVTFPIDQSALVVGGGLAGLTAALAIADHGFQVDLVEQSGELGGNLRELHRTLGGGPSPQDLLKKTVSRVEKHPKIRRFMKSRVVHSQGTVGRFLTTIQKEDGSGEAIHHGVTVLATGGGEAVPSSYGYGDSEAIVTQHQLELLIQAGTVKPQALRTVAMIQCVESREGDRNYCSRVCCASALKNALFLKEKSPDLEVVIFYRDLMSYGFMEAHYTEARRAGVIFIQYTTDARPRVTGENGRVSITALDPILERDITVQADLLVLSPGIVPSPTSDKLARIFGIERNVDGFFQEAESKWRPVECLKEGITMAGLAHSPRSIEESVAMAEAAAQRALAVISHPRLAGSSITAEVRQTLCSLCEQCIAACPYGARYRDEEDERVVVNELMCQGCGACAAVCPNSASVLRGYRDQQVMSMLDAALEFMA